MEPPTPLRPLPRSSRAFQRKIFFLSLGFAIFVLCYWIDYGVVANLLLLPGLTYTLYYLTTTLLSVIFDSYGVATHPVPAHVLPQSLLQRRFKVDKIPAQIDAIIIGSGPGGLGVGSALSHAGKRVLVLEQHDRAGGGAHTYESHGYSFDTGVHYIGEVQDKSWPLRRVMDYLVRNRRITKNMSGNREMDSTIDFVALEDCPIVPDVYDVLVTSGDNPERIELIHGVKGFRESLKKHFPLPEDHVAIDAFIRLCEETSLTLFPSVIAPALPEWLREALHSFLEAPRIKFASQTTKSVIDGITKNKRLAGVLTYLWGCYASVPSKSSWFAHALVSHHYILGGSYPVGGPSSLAKGLVSAIIRRGGEVLVNARVEEIVVENGRAVGVRVGDYIIRAPVVVSGVGTIPTFKLLPETFSSHPYITSITVCLSVAFLVVFLTASLHERTQPTRGHVFMFIGLRGANLQLPRHNLWLFPSFDHEYNMENFVLNPENFLSPDGEPLFGYCGIGFPSVKDPEWKSSDRHTAQMIFEVPYDWFKDANNTKTRHRGEDHEYIKSRFSDALMQLFYTHYPHLKSAVDFVEVGTPLCTNYYLGKLHGESYGLEPTPAHIARPVAPRSPVAGLVLTGQDVSMDGFSGALMGALVTAGALLGVRFWLRIGAAVGLGAVLFPSADRPRNTAAADTAEPGKTDQ